MISAIALLMGIIFFLADHESGIWVLLAMLGLVAIIAFTAWFTSWYNYRQNKKYSSILRMLEANSKPAQYIA